METKRDLSVLVDESLKFQRQAAAAMAKTNQFLAVIRRSFVLTNEATLPRLYNALVHPHLGFDNVAWGPFNHADQLLVQWVQGRVTHLASSINHQPFKGHLDSGGPDAAITVLPPPSWQHDPGVPYHTWRSRSVSR